jgi:hypothetical protein
VKDRNKSEESTKNNIRQIFGEKTTKNGRGRKMNIFKVKDTIK